MQFNSVEIENFLSYENQGFEFKDNGLTLIEGRNLDEGGSNGAGKSSMWDGISWCLFGNTLRGLKADEVIRRNSKGGASVSITLQHDGSEYLVQRHRKHKEYSNRLLVLKDKVPYEKGTVVMTQDWLLEELGIDYDLFRCTIMFAQGETFDFVSSGNKAQKEILSKIMRLNFESFHSKAKKMVKDKGELRSRFEREIDILKSHRSPELKPFENEIKEWDSEKKESFNSVKERLKDRLESVLTIEKKFIDTGKLSEMETKLSDVIEKINTKKGELIRKEATEIAMKDVESRALLKLGGCLEESVCPTCFQTVSKEVIREHQKEHERNAEKHGESSEKLLVDIEKLYTKESEINEKLKKVTLKVSGQRELRSEKKSLKSSVEDLKEEIKAILKRKNPWVKQREDEIKKQAEIEKKLVGKNDGLEKLNGELVYYDFWVNGFGDAGIKSFLFDLVCSTLTERSNHYANILTNGQVVINFDTQTKTKSGETREKFECSVLTDGEKVKYEAYSGGEKRRISLSVDMALSDLMADYYKSSFNIVVFDEQDTYLDKEGRVAFMNLLREKAKTKRVFVVAHDAEFKSLFDDVWSIEKRGGISKYEN